jgi:hypothetical protein
VQRRPGIKIGVGNDDMTGPPVDTFAHGRNMIDLHMFTLYELSLR